MKYLATWVLVLLLAIPVLGRERTPAEQALQIRRGTELEVALSSGELLRGRMGTVSSTGFVVLPMKSDQGISRTVAFTEVTAIHTPKHAWRKIRKTVLITFVAEAAVIGVVLIFLSASGQLH